MARNKLMTLTVLAVFAGGCALVGGGGSAEPDEFGEPVSDDFTLEVQNDNFYDATIYAVRLGNRMRIGWVPGHTADTFQFKWPAMDLSFEISLLAVGSYFTYPLTVEPGDQLALRVLPDLHRRAPGTVF